MNKTQELDSLLGRVLLGLCEQGNKNARTIAAIVIRDPDAVSNLFGESATNFYANPNKFLDAKSIAAILRLPPPVLAQLANGILSIATSDRQFKKMLTCCLDHSLSDEQLCCVAESVYFRGLNRKRCIPMIPVEVIQRLNNGIDVVLAAKCIVHVKDFQFQAVEIIIDSLSNRGARAIAMRNALAEVADYTNIAGVFKSSDEVTALRLLLEQKSKSASSPYYKARLQKLASAIVHDSGSCSL